MRTLRFGTVVFALFAAVIVAVQASAEEKSNVDCPLSLPQPIEFTGDFPYFTFGVPIDKCAAISGCCKEAGATIACSAACDEHCKVAKKKTCENCQCCESCNCSKPKNAHNLKLHDQLVQALTENAYLKARAEAQHELAAQKEAFLHELIEAKVEVATLQAHLEIAQHRRQNIHAQVAHLPQPPSHHHPVIVQLKSENAALKAQVAALEQRLQEFATRAAHHAAEPPSAKR